MAGLYSEAFIETLREGAQSVLHEWDLPPTTSVNLLTVSENATFRADHSDGGPPVVIRVHRPGYHTRAEIESELAWINALREDNVVATPRPLDCASGGHIAGFDTTQGWRDVVAFEFMAGDEPSPDNDLAASFHKLGAINASLHSHASIWQRPGGFSRKTWTFDTIVGRTPHWGDWREALGLTDAGRDVLERAAAELERRLADYGAGPDRFGLIHADLRLANLLVDSGRVGVIDFDDCGFGWFGFDFAAAISFIEMDPQVPALMDAWIEGYQTVSPLSDDAVAMLSVFVMLRRLQLTAWIASHSETPTAKELGDAYTAGTVDLAEQFLSR